MKELVLMKQELNGEFVDTVESRDLQTMLVSRKDFSDWVKNKVVNNPFFMQGVDFTLFPQSGGNSLGGRPRKDYALTLDTAKKVAMAEQTEAGNSARDYFIECERIAKGLDSADQPTLPQTYLEALKSLVQVTEEKEALKAEMIPMQIKLDHHNSHATVTKGYGMMGEAINRVDAVKVGKKLSVISRNNDIPIYKTTHERWGAVNAYHYEAWLHLGHDLYECEQL